MTKIDTAHFYPNGSLYTEDYPYAWRIDMVPSTICTFETDGSVYAEFVSEGDNGINVYYTKEMCPDPLGNEVDDVTGYWTYSNLE